MGYIEPIEFCRLGLLAVTLVSISSPDDELRKLGYESLAMFKTSLEVTKIFIPYLYYVISMTSVPVTRALNFLNSCFLLFFVYIGLFV